MNQIKVNNVMQSPPQQQSHPDDKSLLAGESRATAHKVSKRAESGHLPSPTSPTLISENQDPMYQTASPA